MRRELPTKKKTPEELKSSLPGRAGRAGLITRGVLAAAIRLHPRLSKLQRRQRLRIQRRLHALQSRASLQFLAACGRFRFFRFHQSLSSVRVPAARLVAFQLLASSRSSCVPPQLLAANRFAFCCAALSLHATSAPIPVPNRQNAMPLVLLHLPPLLPAVNCRVAPATLLNQLIFQLQVGIFNIPAPDAPH
jgi:hypothetical protein